MREDEQRTGQLLPTRRGTVLVHRLAPLALASGGALLMTAALVTARPYTSGLSNLYLVHLVWVLACAVRWGMGAASVTAVVGVLTYDYLFLQPSGLLRVRAADDWLELAIFLAAAALVSRLAVGARARAAAAARAEAEARNTAAADQLKAALLSSLSHDLRTPLASLRAAAGTLRRSLAQLDRTEQTELLETVEQESARLSEVLTNLLDLSRYQAGAFVVRQEWCPVDELIWTAIDRSPGLSGRSLQVDIAPNVPAIRGDAALLDRVVVNLLENAAKLSPAETPVQVTANANYVAGGLDGPPATEVVLCVTDAGPGVPEADRMRIFEPFYRAPGAHSPGTGTGLGLAICRALVEAHGGRIWAADAPGGGAQFCIAVPAAGEAAETSER